MEISEDVRVTLKYLADTSLNENAAGYSCCSLDGE